MLPHHAHLTLESIEQQLLVTRGAAPREHAATDPVSDATLRVSLEQLRPYEHNPRFLANPRYAELKASIRQRGLDQPPVITRRPGEAHYILRNGGNTRLAILNELWQETSDERFFHLDCLYKPWSDETCALLGHLAENELHGSLSFVERALSVGTLKRFFEQDGNALTQTELATRLSAGGYPVSQSHVSRMLETLEHLLPGLPQALRAGLGKPQIERLLSLRRQAQRLCTTRYPQTADQFQAIWTSTLLAGDTSGPVQIGEVRVRLAQQLSSHLACSQQELDDALGTPTKIPATAPAPIQPVTPQPPVDPPLSRVERIREQIAQLTADETTDAASSEAVWPIAPSLDSPAALRREIHHLANALATAAGITDCITEQEGGLGYACQPAPGNTAPLPLFIQWTLTALMPNNRSANAQLPLAAELFAHLLLGLPQPGKASAPERLPDALLLQLFRLIRLGRRLLDPQPFN